MVVVVSHIVVVIGLCNSITNLTGRLHLQNTIETEEKDGSWGVYPTTEMILYDTTSVEHSSNFKELSDSDYA